MAAVIAYVAGIGAARRLGAKLASFIGMAEVLFAWLPLGQLPSPVQFLDGAFILAGIALARASELPSSQAPATAEAHEDPEQAPAGADPRAERAAAIVVAGGQGSGGGERHWVRPQTASQPRVCGRRTPSGTRRSNG